jgi:hypothetical protein
MITLKDSIDIAVPLDTNFVKWSPYHMVEDNIYLKQILETGVYPDRKE